MSDDHLKLIKEPIRNSFEFIGNETIKSNMDKLNKHYEAEFVDVKNSIEDLKMQIKNKIIAVSINFIAWFVALEYFTVLAPILYKHGSSAAFNAMIALSIISVIVICYALVLGISYWKELK